MKRFDEKYNAVLKGIAYGKTIEDIAKKHKTTKAKIKKEIKKGEKVESEHTKDKPTKRRIAKDHVYEKPKYYTNNPKI